MRFTVLIATKVGYVDAIVARLGTEQAISSVTVVAGIYDLVVQIETDDPEHYRELILDVIHGIEGVEDTVTLLHLT